MPTNHRVIGRAVVAVALLAGALSFTPAASAGSRGHSQSSGMTASTQWIEFGPLPGVDGNVHIGNLFIDASTRRAFAYGGVADWTCPDGERPSGGGHGVLAFDEPLPETNCTHEGFRSIYGDASQITFAMDKKLTQARLTGNLEVSSHGAPGVARPPVNMTLTGFGSNVTEKQRGTFSDGFSTYNYTFTNTYRQATVTGRIGIMDFTDDADDESSASMGTYRSMNRWVSR